VAGCIGVDICVGLCFGEGGREGMFDLDTLGLHRKHMAFGIAGVLAIEKRRQRD
jgi:hypothetical protein